MQRGDYCSSFGCKKCKKVVEYCNEELSELMKGTKCKECNGDLIDYPKEMRSFDIGKDRLICPKCGERKLKIVRDKGYEV
ncbi:MAG: hypothetical protein KKC75_07710 [Nanoarchaeota archaeon]|nr:hypothetical protein [Nanoarchaeota archaeon]MBU1005075.1 hypothetical protein [Nanoarchaeota archaeon]MBU1945360.1 hypothetical protein [Nanoarchaeota archaeon]